MKNGNKNTIDENGIQGKKIKARDFEKRISTLEKEIQELAMTIDTVEDEKLEVMNQLKKALADYQNLENSIDRRLELRMSQTKISVAQSLMTLMDDIHYGLKAKEILESSTISKEVASWLDGLSETVNKMSNTLGELDIELMKVEVGDDFDSAKHEVVTVIPGEENNKIVELLQPGYVMGEMIVRPARVIISKK